MKLSWQFIREQAGLLTWGQVECGLRWGFCDIDTALGCEEARVADTGERTLPDPELDPFLLLEEVAQRAAAECGRQATPVAYEAVPPWLGGPGPDPDPVTERLWRYLAFAWLMAGHPEPCRDPLPESAPLVAKLESLWAELGHPAETGFIVPWLPASGTPVERAVPFTAGNDYAVCAIERMALWLELERAELQLPRPL